MNLAIVANVYYQEHRKKHETMKNVAVNVLFKTFAKIFLYLQGESQNGGNKKTQHTKFPKKKSKYFLPVAFILAPF